MKIDVKSEKVLFYLLQTFLASALSVGLSYTKAIYDQIGDLRLELEIMRGRHTVITKDIDINMKEHLRFENRLDAVERKIFVR